MDVIWWAVPVVACVALAACIAAALFRPRRDQPEQLRALANTRRLTRLPEYRRAVRRHTIASAVVIAALTLGFVAAAMSVARPTGLPAPDRSSAAEQPEDIMVCAGAAGTDPAVDTTLRYFAEAVQGYGTERIGLTSANRRVIPMTRDHQHAAGQFARAAPALVSPVAYVDYTAGVEDVLAMCLTGFPEFDTTTGTRRSLIYVGPATTDAEGRPSLFSAQRVRELAADAGVQVNAVSDATGLPAELAAESGGRLHSRDGDIAAALNDIRNNPPPAQRDDRPATARSVETPEILLAAALLALAVIGVVVLTRRRAGLARRYVLPVAAVALLVALWRPVVGGADASVTRIAGESDPNIFLIVDRSAAMPEAARSDIDAVIERYPAARVALISFDARPSLDWPLSADVWSLAPVLDAATPNPATDDVTTNVGAASNVLRYQLIAAVQQFPRAQNLVFYFGAGAPESTVPQREFRIPPGSVDGGAVFGYTDTGAPRLRAVADQIGVPYLPTVDVDALDEGQTGRPQESTTATSGFELYWALAAAAAVLILFELYQALWQLRRTRLDRIEVRR
ncbi:hypothetical protein ACWDUN_12460 [Mycobacterium sp. NPDC003323]